MKTLTPIAIRIILLFAFTVLPLSASAGIFHYDFDVLKEADWELWGNHSVWQVKDGFLRATIQAPDFDSGLFQFKGIPGNYETFEFFADRRVIQRQVHPGHEVFTISVSNLGSKSAGFGIAIGRRFPEVDKEHSFCYLFNTYGIEARTYKWGYAAHWWDKEPRHPDVLDDIMELASMEIRFDRGHFQWFADGEKRAEFEDPDFSLVEIIGFMIQSNGIEVEVGSAWADSFTISGPGLAVSPQAKLATKWGTLKRF